MRMRRSTSIGRSALCSSFPPQVYELVCLVVHLANYLYAEYGGGLLHHVRALAHDLSLGLRYGEAKRRAHDYDHAYHLYRLLGRLRDDSGVVSVNHAP